MRTVNDIESEISSNATVAIIKTISLDWDKKAKTNHAENR